eukprot:c16747_g1_i1 orf=455-928(-)
MFAQRESREQSSELHQVGCLLLHIAMVGIFSRLSALGHRSQNSLEEKEISDIAKEAPVSPGTHGVEPTEEFVPVEHPMEPSDNDQPVRCPPPEPCIIHDGRIWKERLHLSLKRRGELPFVKDSGAQGLHRRRHTVSSERFIHPSTSAPEKSITKLLR